ncbi:MAG: helix-turn-helix domain-containing protein [Gemmobacter sp.]|uniref:helix-turn-helix domain-containing protein n=1 Tax=Gemmobacter sp. TaxID=1898957 RepID=UPI00391C43FF
MTDVERPSELVQRLHRLRIERGLTIQQMAEACGLPKSTLESYMKMSGAKRPGVDALIAIADAMQVSLDWLVGRAESSLPLKLGEKDYAVACFNVVFGVLQWLQAESGKHGGELIHNDRIAGFDGSEIAAKAMFAYMKRLQAFANNSDAYGLDRQAFFEDMKSLLARDFRSEK